MTKTTRRTKGFELLKEQKDHQQLHLTARIHGHTATITISPQIISLLIGTAHITWKHQNGNWNVTANTRPHKQKITITLPGNHPTQTTLTTKNLKLKANPDKDGVFRLTTNRFLAGWDTNQNTA